MEREPLSLQEAIVYFDNPDNCVNYLSERRWTDGEAVCPTCGSKSVNYSAKRRTWQCAVHHPKREFSIKVGTIMEDSAIPLSKWLTTIWLVTNCKNGVSSYEVAKAVKVSQKSAWFMLHRIRLGLRSDSVLRIGGGDDGGPVEVDETYIGGKEKNKHLNQRAKRFGFTSTKAIVMGMLDRDSREVRTKVIPHAKREVLQQEILDQVVPGSKVYTDGHTAYVDLAQKNFVHETVNHLNEYVRGQVHTQGIENFWSLLKRTLNGTYVAVEPFHLERYADEQAFRFNNRGTRLNPITDADRFDLAVRKITGKRLTFAGLTGKVGSAAAF